jgi:phytanoyl-CoA hydroxylase
VVIDEQQWQRFSIDGFLHLGRVLTGPELEALRERAGELAAGTLHNDRVVMALEGGGEAASAGAHGYRQIQGLEHDDVFRSLVAHPLFLEVCARMYAPHAAVSVFSATVLNEPGGQTAATPWRQNGGSAWQLDRDPLVTIWVALDDATIANGCVEAVRGSHRNGLLSADGGALSEQETELYCDPEQVVALELPCGHAVLLHSWLIHRAAANASSQSRRAFAGCYLDGRTINISTGQHYAVVAGTVDQSPYPFIGQLERDRSGRQPRSGAGRAGRAPRARRDHRPRVRGQPRTAPHSRPPDRASRELAALAPPLVGRRGGVR